MNKSSSNTWFINNMVNVPKFDFLLATSKSMRKKELKVKDENDEKWMSPRCFQRIGVDPKRSV